MAEEPLPKRFASTTPSDRAQFVADAVPDNTKCSTKSWVSALQEYSRQVEKSEIDFQSVDGDQLATRLEGFYADARKKDGTKYRRNSLLASRGAINRHWQTFQPTRNIFRDAEFKNANQILDGVLKATKRQGEEPTVNHKSALADADLQVLDSYFADVLETADPRKLTYYVWY